MEKQAQASFEKLTLNDKGDSASGVISLEQIRSLMCASADSGKDSSATYGILKSCIDRVQCTDLDFSMFVTIYPSEPEFALKVLKLFATEKAATISTFSYKIQHLPNEGGPICAELAKMHNLVQIHLHSCHISFETLMDMCGKLPKLKEIIFMFFISSSPLPFDDPFFAKNFKKRLMRLENINFVPMFEAKNKEVAVVFQEKLTNFCVINLPNIHIIRTNVLASLSQACRELKGQSRLEHMVIKAVEVKDFTQNLAKFPSVEGISIIDEDCSESHLNHRDICENICRLKSLPNLVYLRVQDLVSADHLKLYLSTCGRNLVNMLLHCTPESNIPIDFDVMQRHCPKLERVEIYNAADVDDSKSLDKFTTLLRFTIVFKSSSPRKIQLTNLISAPQLRTVKIIGFQITRQELMKAIEAVERATILKNVHEVQLKLHQESDKMKSAIEKGMKRFISSLQKLRQSDLTVKFDFMKNCD